MYDHCTQMAIKSTNSTSKPGTTQMNKDQFYDQLDRAYAACPSHDVKMVMGDAKRKSWAGNRKSDNDKQAQSVRECK
jgi:major membrane immunogen (membrane-anchored lipoprotein)